MASTVRIVLPGGWAGVVSRGHRRGPLFLWRIEVTSLHLEFDGQLV
jgi:hypothetical protein